MIRDILVTLAMHEDVIHSSPAASPAPPRYDIELTKLVASKQTVVIMRNYVQVHDFQ